MEQGKGERFEAEVDKEADKEVSADNNEEKEGTEMGARDDWGFEVHHDNVHQTKDTTHSPAVELGEAIIEVEHTQHLAFKFEDAALKEASKWPETVSYELNE